jgi:hypothetical protein
MPDWSFYGRTEALAELRRIVDAGRSSDKFRQVLSIDKFVSKIVNTAPAHHRGR